MASPWRLYITIIAVLLSICLYSTHLKNANLHKPAVVLVDASADAMNGPNLLPAPHMKRFGLDLFQPMNLTNLTPNSTNTTSPSAPLYHNVSSGQAWVLPATTHDFGARGMSCECFDPDLKCCTGQSASTGLFCVAQNATCCADTYCPAGETCCGDACCSAGLSCSFDSGSPSCCPHNQHCTGTPICYDYPSANCSSALYHSDQCCPSTLPYCRVFEPYGLGCYASPNNTLASTATTSFPPQGPKDGSRSHETPSTKYSSTFTETVSVVPLSSGQYSFAFPSSLASQTPGVLVSTGDYSFAFPSSLASPIPITTTYVLDYPASMISTNATTNSSTSTPRHTITTMPHTTTSSSQSQSKLCFNANIGRPAPCTSSVTADDGGFPGASTVSSGCVKGVSVLFLVVSGVVGGVFF